MQSFLLCVAVMSIVFAKISIFIKVSRYFKVDGNPKQLHKKIFVFTLFFVFIFFLHFSAYDFLQPPSVYMNFSDGLLSSL